MDIASEMGPEEQREYFKTAFQLITTLNSMGYAVSAGVRNMIVGAGSDQSSRLPFGVLVMVVAPTAEATEQAVVPRRVQFGF